MGLRIGLMTLAAVACFTTAAQALPPIPGYIKESLGDNKDYQAFSKKLAAEKSKCIVCHNAGEDKKKKGHALNTFGKVMHDHLDHKAFMAAHKAKETDKALEIFNSAWKATLAEKNAGGKSFDEVIRAGELP